MLIKAFLSHDSKDKPIVEEVAERLSRVHCVYDKYSFETGEDLDASIKKGLDVSQLFVLFVSQNTLARPFVQKEISLAEELYEKNNLKKAFAFIIDDIDVNILPSWIKRIKYEKTFDPAHMARVIKKKITDLNNNQSHFIGRDEDAIKFEEIISDENKKRNIFFITGIIGIGKKTFSRHMLVNKLLVSFPCCVEVKPGDGALEMALNAMDCLESTDSFKEIYQQKKDCSVKEKTEFLINKLKEYLERGEGIIFCDEGGVIHTDGSIDDEMLFLLESITQEIELPVFFNTYIKPPLKLKFRQCALKPLSRDASKLLFKRLLPRMRFDDNELIENVINRSDGYPPSIYYAAEMLAQYGPGINLKDKIKENSYGIFSQYVSSLNIQDPYQRKILALLCVYSPLPHDVLIHYTKLPLTSISDIIENLVDKSVLEIDENSLYEISRPLKYTIFKFIANDIRGIDHKLVKDIISHNIDKNDDANRKLLLYRHITKSKMYLNEKYNDEDMICFLSDIYAMAETSYHEQNYKDAIKYASKIIAERRKFIEAHEILIKSYIREEKFTEAQNAIDIYKEFAEPKSIFYLTGFLKRYNDDFSGAVKQYKHALDNGYTGVSIYRELAQCYILLDENEKALEYAKKAYEKLDSNVFIIDIYATALAKNAHIDEAKNIINQMLAYPESDFTLHRLSIFEFAYGNPRKALTMINKAISLSKRITFDILAQKVLIACECGYSRQARDAFEELRSKFKNKRSEMQKAVLMRLYFAENNNNEAKIIYESIKNSKNSSVRNIIKNCKDKYHP